MRCRLDKTSIFRAIFLLDGFGLECNKQYGWCEIVVFVEPIRLEIEKTAAIRN